MDTTNVNSFCCPGNIMTGAGAHLGGRVNVIKLKCPECDKIYMVIPMEKGYDYNVKATTEKERIAERIEQARIESELELAKTITRIKETGY